MSTFMHDEAAQDLIEYTLLLAFVALVAAGLFISAGQSTSGVWSSRIPDFRARVPPPLAKKASLLRNAGQCCRNRDGRHRREEHCHR